MSKVAQAAPQHYSYLLKTAEEVHSSPFRDEIISELNGILKKAEAKVANAAGNFVRGAAEGVREGWNAMPSAGRFLAGAAGAGIAINLGGDMYEAVKRGLMKGRRYKKMLEENPDLRGKANNAVVQRHFNTLHRFNPEYASDPYVAGSYVRQNMDLQSDDLGALHSLVKARNDIRNAQSLRPMPLYKPPDVS